jgi:hypothetical protein
LPSAIQLRETKNSLRAVSVDLAAYNSTLALARDQQLKFGGSLQENIEGLLGLSITSRQSGVDLKQLVDLSQRLNVLSPEQGVQGARIALAEALSGNITSLSRRFEIPKAAIRALADESKTTEERLASLNDFLNTVGVTSAAVAGKIDQDALAYRRLGAEIGDLTTNVGDGLASGFSRAATGLSRLIGLINENPKAIAEVKALFTGQGTIAPTQIEDANRKLATSRAADQLAPARFSRQLSDAELGPLREQIISINLVSKEAAAAADHVVSQWVVQKGAASDLQTELQKLAVQYGISGAFATGDADASRGLATVSIQVADAIAEARRATEQSIQSTLADTAAKEALGVQTELAKLKAESLANAFLQANPLIDEAGVRTAILAGTLPEVAGQLALARLQIQGVRAELAALQSGGPAGTVEGRLERDRASDLAEAKTAGAALVRQQQDAARLARENQVLQTGSQKGQLRILQDRYNAAVRLHGVNSAEAINAQTVLKAEQASQALAKKRGAPKPTTGLGALEKDAIKLQDDSQAALAEVNRQLEKGNLTQHQRNQLLIQQRDLQEKIADEQERANRATLDAQLGTVKDRQQDIKDARERAGLERQLQSGRFSAAQQEIARLRLQEIALEDQKRTLDIQKDARTAGLAAPGAGATPTATGAAVPVGAQAPVFAVPAVLPPTALQPIINLPITITIDQVGQAHVTNQPSGVNLSVLINKGLSRVAG